MTIQSGRPRMRHRSFPGTHRILAFISGGAPGTTAPMSNTDYGAPQVGPYGNFPESNSLNKRLATQGDTDPDSPPPAIRGLASTTGGTPAIPDSHNTVTDGGTEDLAARNLSALADPPCGVPGCAIQNGALPTTPSPASGGEGRDNEPSSNCSDPPGGASSPSGSCGEGQKPGILYNSTTDGRYHTTLVIAVNSQPYVSGENISSTSTGTIFSTSSTSSPNTTFDGETPLTTLAINTGHGDQGGPSNITTSSSSPSLSSAPPSTDHGAATRFNTTTVTIQTPPPVVVPVQSQNSSTPTSTGPISTTSNSIHPGNVVPQDTTPPLTPTTITPTSSESTTKDAVTTKPDLGQAIPETTPNTTKDFATTYSLTISPDALHSSSFSNILPGTTATQSAQGPSAVGGPKSSIDTAALIAGCIAAALLIIAALIFLFFHCRRRPVHEEWRESFIGGPPLLRSDSSLPIRHIDFSPSPGYDVPQTMQNESPEELWSTFVGPGSSSAVPRKAVPYLDRQMSDQHPGNRSSSSHDSRTHLMPPDPFAAHATQNQNPFSDTVPPNRASVAASKSERTRSFTSTSSTSSKSHYDKFAVAF